MTRFLAYTSPARGHLFPIVATLLELRARGHEVAVRTLASEVGRMRELGFAAAPIAREIEDLPFDDWKARTPIGANKRVAARMAARAEHELRDLPAAIEAERPDALLVDISTMGAATVAEAGPLPWAQWTPYFTPVASGDAPPFGLGLHPRHDRIGRLRDAVVRRVALSGPERLARRSLNELRPRLGLPPVASGFDHWAAAPLHLYFTAEPFEYPRSDWPASFRLVGPGLWEPPADPPAWLGEIRRPLVLVTLSTEFQDDGKLARVALEALAGDEYDVVVTTGSVDASSLDVPANARVERFLPHGPLVERAACVVCHGGMGITQKALAAGVPVCVVPFGRDQLEVAGHVTWCDAGVRLASERLSAERLRAAVRRAIGKRAGAERVAQGFAAAGGARAAAGALERLVSKATDGAPAAAYHGR
ncbi:MAG TPA: nucleotide disphospho-sugar-binding domain-containing protein [Solirubrobacteraceae bacterium]|jgi:MGT family glycosyltransferase